MLLLTHTHTHTHIYIWISQRIIHNTYIKLSNGNCENADLYSKYSGSAGLRNMHVKLMLHNILCTLTFKDFWCWDSRIGESWSLSQCGPRLDRETHVSGARLAGKKAGTQSPSGIRYRRYLISKCSKISFPLTSQI